MSYSFERRHDILIAAPPEAILTTHVFVIPYSWPEWLAASHHIDGAYPRAGNR